MNDIITTLVNQLPNIGVALLMLYWQKQTIESLLANQTKLVDQLLTYVTKDKETVQQVISANTAAQAQNSGAPH